MDFRLQLLIELLYGAALLTAIAAAPDIEIKLRIKYEAVQIVSYGFPDIWVTLMKALLVTALAMMPTVMRLPKCLTKWRLFKYLPMAPWILTCCLKFPLHLDMYIATIRNAAQYIDPTSLIVALVIYVIFFEMAIELAWLWISYAHLCLDGYVVVKSVSYHVLRPYFRIL